MLDNIQNKKSFLYGVNKYKNKRNFLYAVKKRLIEEKCSNNSKLLNLTKKK